MMAFGSHWALRPRLCRLCSDSTSFFTKCFTLILLTRRFFVVLPEAHDALVTQAQGFLPGPNAPHASTRRGLVQPVVLPPRLRFLRKQTYQAVDEVCLIHPGSTYPLRR